MWTQSRTPLPPSTPRARTDNKPSLLAQIHRFSEKERSRVRFFCCDMSPEMVAVQRRWLPRARLCIDRFHVVRLANKALSDVRKRVQADESMPAERRRELKGSWRLLVLGRDRLRAMDDEDGTGRTPALV